MKRLLLPKILTHSVPIFQRFAHALLAPHCWLCAEPTPLAHPELCAECQQQLPWNHHACYRCALPLPDSSPQHYCGRCLRQEPLFARTVSVFTYQEPINGFLNALKFQQQLSYSRFLGQHLVQAIQQQYADESFPSVLIPVPLHKKRLQERGFNQALEIARLLRKPLNIRIDAHSVKRTRATPHQIQLTAVERRRNLRDAFTVTKSLPEHVAILDDVVTTTSTVTELCRTLLSSGVKRVDVWCVARTPVK